jgi:hypothetical protein
MVDDLRKWVVTHNPQALQRLLPSRSFLKVKGQTHPVKFFCERSYDLCHWSALAAIDAGNDIETVADRLDFANAAMTLRVYPNAFSSFDCAVADSGRNAQGRLVSSGEDGLWSSKVVRHVFVDESVRRDGRYRLTGVAVPVAELAVVSRALRARTPSGATRMHFSSESDKRRRATLRSLSNLSIEAVTIVAPYPVRSSEETARNACIAELVALATRRVASLTFDTRGPDRDKSDRLVIRKILAAAGDSGLLYGHRGSRDEVLLSLPDCIGWAVGAGGRWLSLVAGFTEVIELPG